MAQKLFLTGQPKSGKSTLIHKLISAHPDQCYGFYTQELRENDVRVGFEIIPINIPIKNGLLSHVNIKSDVNVGKYNVDTSTLDNIVKCADENFDENKLLIIDEIGLMQSLSPVFQTFVSNHLESSAPLLAAINEDPFPWTDQIKENYAHIEQKILTVENRYSVYQEISDYFSPFFSNRP